MTLLPLINDLTFYDPKEWVVTISGHEVLCNQFKRAFVEGEIHIPSCYACSRATDNVTRAHVPQTNADQMH